MRQPSKAATGANARRAIIQRGTSHPSLLLTTLASAVLSHAAACATPEPKRDSSGVAQAQSTRALPSATTNAIAPIAAPHASSPNCPTFSSGEVLFTFRDSQLAEISGLVASHHIPGLLWVHNDSGDAARVYGIQDGALRYRVTLGAVEAIDFEDIALAPRTATTDWIYVADTGDNFRVRPEVTVYRFAEPDLNTLRAKQELQIDAIERVHVRYPGGPQDVEALFVDPQTKDLYFVHKGRIGVNYLYRVENPLMKGEHVEAKKLASLPVGLVTAADISRDGRSILIRTYLDVLLWQRKTGQGVVDALVTSPCAMPHAEEPQGESIALSADGAQYLTISEGIGQPVYAFSRVTIPQSPR